MKTLKKVGSVIAIGAILAWLGLSSCSKPGSTMDPAADDPVQDDPVIDNPQTNTQTNYNIADVNKTISKNMTNASVDVTVSGDYDPATTDVKIDDSLITNYSSEIIDQIYKISTLCGVGNYVIDVKDNDDNIQEVRNVKIKVDGTKDVYNNLEDISNSSYSNDLTGVKGFDNNATIDLISNAYTNLSASGKTIVDGIMDDSNLTFGRSSLENLIISPNNIYITDKKGRIHVMDFSDSDKQAIEDAYVTHKEE